MRALIRVERDQRLGLALSAVGAGSEQADDLKVFLGQPGRGPATFCATQEHILLAGEVVRATLIYRDGMGKEQRSVCELKERC